MACDADLRLGWVVTGADASPAMLERARARLPNVEFRVAEPTRLHTAVPRTFDAVVSVGNALYLLTREQLPTALGQMRACLRPGGSLMLVVRDLDEPRSAVWRDDPTARVTARFRREGGGRVAFVLQVEDALGLRTHEQLLNPLPVLDLASAVEKAGLRVTRAGRWPAAWAWPRAWSPEEGGVRPRHKTVASHARLTHVSRRAGRSRTPCGRPG